MKEKNVSANDQIIQLRGSKVYNVDGKTLESETSETEINDNKAQRKTIYGKTVAIWLLHVYHFDSYLSINRLCIFF